MLGPFPFIPQVCIQQTLHTVLGKILARAQLTNDHHILGLFAGLPEKGDEDLLFIIGNTFNEGSAVLKNIAPKSVESRLLTNLHILYKPFESWA
ncbi:MAG: hypothetical protein H6641_23265 [Caldilineaceae bacterium]|nr:hypothetical protein [Caldilineaceae bacterium]